MSTEETTTQTPPLVATKATEAKGQAPKSPAKAKANKASKKVTVVGPGPHRLETSWSFWHSHKTKNTASPFENGLTRLATCSTVEEFWK